MTKVTSVKAIAAALLACGLSAAPATALSNRTWVSGRGTDAGACTRAAPCRTFAFAIGQTAARGEIDVLDPAGYGQVTINKSISIVNDGAGTAGILATGVGAIGVLINAAQSDSVHLRGLIIEGLGSGRDGIQFNTGGNLALENSVIRGFGVGTFIRPSTSSSFSVLNTIASNNFVGIVVQHTGSAVATGVLSKVTTNNNGAAIIVDSTFTTGGAISVALVDSEVSHNSDFGVTAAGAATAVVLRNSLASNNGTGLSADQSAVLRIAHSVVTGNNTGVSTALGGTIQSYGDNDIDGNTNNNLGALTTIPTH